MQSESFFGFFCFGVLWTGGGVLTGVGLVITGLVSVGFGVSFFPPLSVVGDTEGDGVAVGDLLAETVGDGLAAVEVAVGVGVTLFVVSLFA